MSDSQFSLFNDEELEALEEVMAYAEEDIRNGKVYWLLEL